MKTPDTNQIISIAYIGAMLIVVFVVYKVFAGVGLIKTGAKKKVIAEQKEATTKLRALDYFDPLYLKNNMSGYTPMKSVKSQRLCKLLRDAIKGIGTDEEAIFGVFSQLKCKYNISELTSNYLAMYNRNLLTDILNEFNAVEKTTLMNIIDQLPKKR